MSTIEKLLADAGKAGYAELTKILDQQEALNVKMALLAKTGVLAPGITQELKMMSDQSTSRIKSIQFIKEKIKC